MRWVAPLMIAALVATVGCEKAAEGTGKNILSGEVKANGQLVADLPLVVTGPDGKTAGGMTNAQGVYLIPDPPQGKLQFTFMATGPAAQLVPQKYTQPNNGLSFDYKGGKQTYNIDLSK